MNRIEQETNKIIKKFDLRIPVDVEGLSQDLNIEIKKADDKDISVSGLLYRKDGVAYMAINSAETTERQRFTIAHEIGHFVLHTTKDIFVEYRQKTYEKNVVRTNKEIEANHFAACLLMPRSEIEKEVKNLNKLDCEVSPNDIHVLANKYQVSDEAMTFRLLNLNLFSKNS